MYINLYRKLTGHSDGFELMAMGHDTEATARRGASPHIDDYELVAVAVEVPDVGPFPSNIFPQKVFA